MVLGKKVTWQLQTIDEIQQNLDKSTCNPTLIGDFVRLTPRPIRLLLGEN